MLGYSFTMTMAFCRWRPSIRSVYTHTYPGYLIDAVPGLRIRISEEEESEGVE